MQKQKRNINETMRMNRYFGILIVVILAVGIFGLSCSGSSNSSTSSSLSQATSDLVSIKFGNVTSVNLDTGIIMFNVSFSPNKNTILGNDGSFRFWLKAVSRWCILLATRVRGLTIWQNGLASNHRVAVGHSSHWALGLPCFSLEVVECYQ